MSWSTILLLLALNVLTVGTLAQIASPGMGVIAVAVYVGGGVLHNLIVNFNEKE